MRSFTSRTSASVRFALPVPAWSSPVVVSHGRAENRTDRLRVSSFYVWPEPVERVAALLRSAGVHGRLEELPVDFDEPPGPAFRAVGFECDGRALVALVPAERSIDDDKLAAAAKCGTLRPLPAPDFPFRRTRVFLDRSALATPIAWLEAGSPRYYLGLAPGQLTRLTRARTADLLLENPIEGGS
jgi:prolyl-tRNA editing enzyme YbaK/EbsC (Cys-tRNA(Pro) deacylase)